MDICDIFNLGFYECAYHDPQENQFKRFSLKYITNLRDSGGCLELHTSDGYWGWNKLIDIGHVRVKPEHMYLERFKHLRVKPEKNIIFKQSLIDCFGHLVACLILDYLSFEIESFPKLRIDFVDDAFKFPLALIYEKHFTESKLLRLSDPQWSPNNIKVIIHDFHIHTEHFTFGADSINLWPSDFSFEYSNGDREFWNPRTFQKSFRGQGCLWPKDIPLTLRFYDGYAGVYFEFQETV